MCRDDAQNRWFLYGVLTREGECLKESHPDIFASISVAKNWIEESIANNE